MKSHRSPTVCSIEALESRIAPATVSSGVDISLTIDEIKMPDVVVPGDKITIKYTIHNNDETHTFKSPRLDVNIWMSKQTTPIPWGYVVSNNPFFNDFKVVRNGTPDISVTIPPKGTKTIVESFDMPILLLDGPTSPVSPAPSFTSEYNMPAGSGYHIIAEVDGAAIVDPFLHNNNSAAGPAFDWEFEFGAVGARKDVALNAQDGDGTPIVFDMSGVGSGELQLSNTTAPDLVFSGTTSGSAAVVTVFKTSTADSRFKLDDITSPGPLNKLKMPMVDVTGNVNLSGGVATALELGDIGNGKTITLGGTEPAPNVTLRRVNDLNINAATGIDLLKVADWQAVGPDTVTAPFIRFVSVTGDSKLGVAGDLEASLTLNGKDAKNVALGGVDVAGQIAGTVFKVTSDGEVGDITGTSADRWTLDAPLSEAGNVVFKGSVTGPTTVGISAGSFEDIKIGGVLANRIATSSSDSKSKLGLESLTARTVDGVEVKATGSGIGKVEVGEWINGGRLEAAFIKTLTTKAKPGTATAGDFTATLSVHGVRGFNPEPKGVTNALGTASILGALKSVGGSLWQVVGSIGSLTAGSVGPGWKLEGATGDSSDPTMVGTLDIKGKVEGTFLAGVFKTVKFGGDFSGIIQADEGEEDEDPFLGSITSFEAAKVVGGQVLTSFKIGKISADQWTGGKITAAILDSLIIKGATNVAADMTGTEVKIEGGGRIGKFGVNGTMSNVTITAIDQKIGSITVGRWTSTSTDDDLKAGSLGSLVIAGGKNLVGDLNGVQITLSDAAADLAKLTVTGQMIGAVVNTAGTIGAITTVGMIGTTIILSDDKGIGSLVTNGKTGGNFFSGSNVHAGKIGKIIVSNVDGSAAGGIAAKSIDHYLRKLDGKIVKKLDGADFATPNSDLDPNLGLYRLSIFATP